MADKEIPSNAPQCVADLLPALSTRARKAVCAWLDAHAQHRTPVTAGNALAVAQALERQEDVHVATVFRAISALLVARGDTVPGPWTVESWHLCRDGVPMFALYRCPVLTHWEASALARDVADVLNARELEKR